MKLQCQEDLDGFERVQIVGQLTPDGWIGEKRDPWFHAFGADVFSKRVLVNMSKVSYVDSMGVEWLLRSHHSFQKAGGRMIVHSLGEVCKQLLNLMRMDLVLEIASDEAAALNLGRESQHEH